MKKLLLILLLTVSIIVSCKKDIPPEDITTTDELARDYLYEVMQDVYLWYNQIPTVTKEDYKDPYEMLDAMRYKELDRWSYVQTYEEYQAQITGTFVGHGIRMGLDAGNQVRIAEIYNNSSLYAFGVRRGWIIKKLNGTDLAPIFLSGDDAAYNQLIGASEAGVTNTFLFQIPDGRDSVITSTKSSFILNTVILFDTLHLKSGITGHLVFDQFITPSNQELESAFAFFQQSNITNLIVDLRYNGGGDITVLNNMASYIAGASNVGKEFLALTYNNKNTTYNQIFNLSTTLYPLNLTKMVAICTRGTASASEDLINGLRPYLDVRCIGDTTNGKPVGMNGINYLTDYMFWPITFKLVNANDQGDFFDGLFPEKYVPDDITRDWNDKDELCLKEAIYYLENGSVSTKGVYDYHPNIQFTEKPARINNAFLTGR